MALMFAQIPVNATVVMETLVTKTSFVDVVQVVDKLSEDGVHMLVIQHSNGWQRILATKTNRTRYLFDPAYDSAGLAPAAFRIELVLPDEYILCQD